MPDLSGVRLPPGVAIDPGGIGKGLAADIMVGELIEQGATGAMVELGGDLRVAGRHPDGSSTWTVAVDDPRCAGKDLLRLGMSNGGIATSSQLERRWATGSGDRHHLIDPVTGDSATSPVASAVVAADYAWRAEMLAKAALIAGFKAGAALIADAQAVGVLYGFDETCTDVGLLEAASPA